MREFVDEHVARRLEAGRVIEEVLRERLRRLQRLVHVAERGGEHDLVPLRGEIAHHALGVGAFRHALDVGRLHLALELRFHRLASDVVREGPAAVADRPDVDKAHAQRLLRKRCSPDGKSRDCCRNDPEELHRNPLR
jgi:hypothetical protein